MRDATAPLLDRIATLEAALSAAESRAMAAEARVEGLEDVLREVRQTLVDNHLRWLLNHAPPENVPGPRPVQRTATALEAKIDGVLAKGGPDAP